MNCFRENLHVTERSNFSRNALIVFHENLHVTERSNFSRNA
jgi:hypothetical protein